MAKVLVVTSGKGGVGKTTSTAALGAALAHNGEKVVVIDFDVGLRNLDLVMGAERRVVFDLINVFFISSMTAMHSDAANMAAASGLRSSVMPVMARMASRKLASASKATSLSSCMSLA